MKRIVIGLLALLCLGRAIADTQWIELRCSPSVSTNFNVPAGKVVWVADYFGPEDSAESYALKASVTRPEGNAFLQITRNSYLVGPCTISLAWTKQITPDVGVYWVSLRISDVLESSATPEFLTVIPKGQPAVVTLQTSSDLKSWQPLSTNTFSASDRNRFFKVSLGQ